MQCAKLTCPSQIEKAPYRKEFEERQRLYDLEDVEPKTSKISSQSAGLSTFRFSRQRKNQYHEISRIKHLPHCPIAVKRQVYEDSVLRPFTHPPQASSAASSRPNTRNLSIERSERTCIGCPAVYAVCEWCRGLGYVGARILHFETDCSIKARHVKDREYGFTHTSAPFRPIPFTPLAPNAEQLAARAMSNSLPSASIQPSEGASYDGVLPDASTSVDLNSLFDFDLNQYDSALTASSGDTAAITN